MAQLPRRVRRTASRADLLADCLDALQRAEVAAAKVDLRGANGDLKREVKALREAVARGRTTAVDALRADRVEPPPRVQVS